MGSGKLIERNGIDDNKEKRDISNETTIEKWEELDGSRPKKQGRSFGPWMMNERYVPFLCNDFAIMNILFG